MNPFLEPTVATPQPSVGWDRSARRPGRRRSAGGPHRQPQSSGEGSHGSRPAEARPQRSRRKLRGLESTLRAFLLAAAMLVPGLAMAVDINTATAEQLQEIKGIGPKTAGLIIEERERGGRFESFADISDRVKGIGPKKAASLEAAGLSVGATVAAAANEAAAPARAARRGR